MAFIDLEFERGFFLQLMQAGLAFGPSVPFPTLSPLGESPATVDRLISRWDWLDRPVWDQGGLPGYTPAPGVGLLRVGVSLDHVGVADLRLDPAAPGVSVTGHVWITMTVTPGVLTAATIAFAAAGAPPAVLLHPLPTLRFPLPALPMPTLTAGIVVDDTVVALRFGTSPDDDLDLPPAHFLDARVTASSANWALHVPAQVFQDLVVRPLSAASGSDPDVSVEDAPTSSWNEFGDGAWGVDASIGVVKSGSCPGIGGDVDISITLSARLAMTVVEVTTPVGDRALDLVVTQGADASDWDSFRCWLGSGGAIGAVLSLLNPVLGVGVALGFLAGISEAIRGAVARGLDAAAAPTVPGAPLTLISGGSDSASYGGRLDLPTVDLPLTTFQEWELTAQGLDCYGQSHVSVPSRGHSFTPNGGTLATGDWTRRINCSHRAVDQFFTYQPIVVTDDRWISGQLVASLPVVRYLTSVAEPMGQAAFEQIGTGIFKLHATSHGPAGWALLHTSAGLQTYQLATVPDTPGSGLDLRHLIAVYCDSQREVDLVVDAAQLLWPEPPPDYDFGFDPLRQWQIVLQALTPDATVSVLDARDGRVLLTRDDFDGAGRNVSTQLVTDADTELVVRVGGAEGVGVVTARRWLVPVEQHDGDAPRGPSTTTAGRLVVVGHEGARVVAVPGQTMS